MGIVFCFNSSGDLLYILYRKTHTINGTGFLGVGTDGIKRNIADIPSTL